MMCSTHGDFVEKTWQMLEMPDVSTQQPKKNEAIGFGGLFAITRVR
jgi:hypothetical protein